jgi:hypothetical protein
MATNDTTSMTEKPVVPSGAMYLGRDAQDRHHYATQMPSSKIVVVDAHERVECVYRVDSDDNPLSNVDDWVTHVRDVCGWADLRYGEDLVDVLAERLEGDA